MRIFAVIVGVLALLLGGSSLVLGNGWISWPAVFFGWMPFIVGWGLASYVLFTKDRTPLPFAAKATAWLLVAGFFVFVGKTINTVSQIN